MRRKELKKRFVHQTAVPVSTLDKCLDTALSC